MKYVTDIYHLLLPKWNLNVSFESVHLFSLCFHVKTTCSCLKLSLD
jgi:hypothetical protein